MSLPADNPLQTLQSFTFAPDGPPQGAALFLHGHGDYSSRYESVLRPFLERGIVCLATDLPGHGGSPGRRGFVPGIRIVDEVVRTNRERARALVPDGPLGLLGHSAGGLLALREAIRNPDHYDFTWFSSPLLRPESTRHPLVVSLLRRLARWLPGLDVTTGLMGRHCRHSDGEAAADPPEAPLFHSRISLQWGTELIDIARDVRARFAAEELPIPALFTQGGADPVCPPSYLRQFLEDVSIPELTYREFDGQLHEPFADEAKEEVQAAIGNWLDAVLERHC